MSDIDFQVRFANRIIRVHAFSSKLIDFCEAYLTDEPPQRSLVITGNDLAWEREHTDANASNEHLEQLVLCRKASTLLLDHNTVLFHGSCLAMDGEGYLFTAPSGTGKSTHARMWRTLFGDRVVMINDDKPFLKVNKAKVAAFGSPWTGEHQLGFNARVPLKALCFLSRDTSNHIEPVTVQETLPLLLEQVYKPLNDEALNRVLPLLERLGDRVELYKLGCTMVPEAARVAYEGMNHEHRV